MVQRKSTHAGDLNTVGQQTGVIFVRQPDQVVQLLRGIEVPLVLPEPVLGDILQHRGGLSIHHAAAGDATLCVDVLHDLPGHAHVIGKAHRGGLEFPRVGHDEIAGREVSHILVHIKATRKVDRHSEQHHRKGQRKDGHHGFAATSAQIGPGHGEWSYLPGLPTLSTGFHTAALGVAHRLHRGNFRRHFPRFPAGEQHREQSKQGGNQEYPGTNRGYSHYPIEPGYDHRRQPAAYEPADHQTDGNTGGGESQGLDADDPPQLPGRCADRLE